MMRTLPAVAVLAGGMMMLFGVGASIASLAVFLSMKSSLEDATATWGGARIDLGSAFVVVVVIGWLLNFLFIAAPVWIQYRLDEVRRMQMMGGVRN